MQALMSATQTSIICQSCWPSRASRTRQTAWAPSQMLTGQSLRRLSCHGLPWPALKTVLCFPPRYHHHAGIAGTTHAQMGSFLDETGCALLSGALGFRSENKTPSEVLHSRGGHCGHNNALAPKGWLLPSCSAQVSARSVTSTADMVRLLSGADGCYPAAAPKSVLC